MDSQDAVGNPVVTRPTLARILWRCGRLRCPVCGQERLFRGLFSMRPECTKCGTVYQREPGFFLGAIYFNYGLTAAMATVVYLILSVTRVATPEILLGGTLLFVLLFPVWFFRYARSLWLGFDQYIDPRGGD